MRLSHSFISSEDHHRANYCNENKNVLTKLNQVHDMFLLYTIFLYVFHAFILLILVMEWFC